MGLSCINAFWPYLKDLAGDFQGVSTGWDILVSPNAGTKTLIHKIAHELIHHGEQQLNNKTILELEAESVSFVVSKHFGLDGLSSPNYVALHGAVVKQILTHLERIRDTAVEIINALEIDEEQFHWHSKVWRGKEVSLHTPMLLLIFLVNFIFTKDRDGVSNFQYV